MTPGLAVLFLSTTGSTAFFLAGVSAGRLLPRKAPAGDVNRLASETTAPGMLEGRLAAADQELDTVKRRSAEVEQALEAEKRRAEAAEARARELGERLESQQSVQPDAASSASEPTPRESELEEEVRRLRGLLDAKPRPIQPASVVAVTDSGGDLNKQLTRANRELVKIRQELSSERATRSRRDDEIRKLKSHVAELEKRIDTVQHNEETQPGDGVAPEAIRELARVQKEMKLAQENHKKEQAQRRKIEKDLAEARQALREANRKGSRGSQENHEAAVAALQRKLDEVTSEKEDLEVRQEASAGYVRRAQQQAKQHKEEADRLKKQLEATSGGVGADELKQALARGRESAAQIVKLKQDLAQAKHDAKRASGAKDEAAKLREELVELRSKATEQTDRLRKQIAEVTKELEDTRARLAKTAAARRSASGTMEAVNEGDASVQELKVRLGQAETRAKQVESLEKENRKLKDELDELRPQASGVAEMRQRIAKLQAKLFALGEKSSPSVAPPPIDPDAYPKPAATQSTLRSLLQPGTTRAVVLADAHGLQVGAEGEPETHEGLAAVTGLMAHLAEQARQLLPLSVVSNVSFRDQNDLIVSCRLFDCQGEGMALATLGTSVPAQVAVDSVVAGVLSTLGQPTSG